MYSSQRPSEKQRALMEVLAQDNGRFLYEDLPKMAGSRVPWQVQDKEDLGHDFFIDICAQVAGGKYDYYIHAKESVHGDRNLKKWLSTSYRRYCSVFRKKETHRIKKPNGKDRPKELSLDRVTKGAFRLTNPDYRDVRDWYKICYEADVNLFELEEVRALRAEKVRGVLEDCIERLSPKQAILVRRFYLERKSRKQIRAELDMSESSFNSNLSLARENLLELLPYSVSSVRGWAA